VYILVHSRYIFTIHLETSASCVCVHLTQTEALIRPTT